MSQSEQRDEVEMLSSMLLIRRCEERASQQYQAQKIGGFCHLYIGQEAVVCGAVAAARPDDYLITAYRDHAHALARGTSANACMAELFGKATGCSRGLGGSMHYFDKEHHMYGGHAIVAAHVPLAVGMAFASKYRNEDRVTLCFFGDGAINQGSFHEALNLAALYKLPVISFLSGILLIRRLDQREYAYFTIANTMQGTLNVLADIGISIGLVSIGGRVWHDRHRFGQLVNTALGLRRKLGFVAVIVVVPILYYLLVKNGASATYAAW